jgi:hypothetical protein
MSSSVEDVAALLTASGLSLNAHDSMYLGGSYYETQLGDCKIVVRTNLDLLDNVREVETSDGFDVLVLLSSQSPDSLYVACDHVERALGFARGYWFSRP